MTFLLEALNTVSSWVWGFPLIILLVGSGAYYSIILRGLPFLRLPEALYLAFVKRKEHDRASRRAGRGWPADRH